MYFAHIADDAGFDDLDAVAKTLQGMALIAELRGKFLFIGQLGQRTHFPDVVREGFSR